MAEHRIFAMPFAKVYPLYVQKAERKDRTKEEVDQVICWLTGYDRAGLQRQIDRENDFATFFAQAPAMHPNASAITGVVCGIRNHARVRRRPLASGRDRKRLRERPHAGLTRPLGRFA